jgi:hypothetical protein
LDEEIEPPRRQDAKVGGKIKYILPQMKMQMDTDKKEMNSSIAFSHLCPSDFSSVAILLLPYFLGVLAPWRFN